MLLIAPPNRIPEPFQFIYIFVSKLELTFLLFWVSSGALLSSGIDPLPSAFKLCLTIETETLVAGAPTSYWRSFDVSQGILTTCLLSRLTTVDSFIYVPSGGAPTIPFTLKF
ncbi:hypothetical protein GOODEAATRI_018695 [Goodea atripinnis]|uniref:Uncharacterized protein n=1 Tax=Goodea atripinnis TaxID=208336 RepID=A0ABV0NLC4_9TELE